MPLRRWWLASAILAPLVGGSGIVTTLLALGATTDGSLRWLWVGGASYLAYQGAALLRNWRRDRLDRSYDAWREELIAQTVRPTTLVARDCIGRAEFESAGLFLDSFNRYTGNTLLTLGALRACNLDVVNETIVTDYEDIPTTNADMTVTRSRVKRTRTVQIRIFAGMFLIVPAPLPAPGRVVLNDPKVGIGRLNSFKVASPTLNGAYTLGADDPFVGHRTLTPVLQAALWRFRELLPKVPLYAYAHGNLYVAVPGVTLKLGERPGWRPINDAWLSNVAEQCRTTVEFLQQAVPMLIPSP